MVPNLDTTFMGVGRSFFRWGPMVDFWRWYLTYFSKGTIVVKFRFTDFKLRENHFFYQNVDRHISIFKIQGIKAPPSDNHDYIHIKRCKEWHYEIYTVPLLGCYAIAGVTEKAAQVVNNFAVSFFRSIDFNDFDITQHRSLTS